MISIIHNKINTITTARQLEATIKTMLAEDEELSKKYEIGITRMGDWSYDITLINAENNTPILKIDVETISHEVGGYHHTNICINKITGNDRYELVDMLNSKSPKFDKDNLRDFLEKNLNNEIYKTEEKGHDR